MRVIALSTAMLYWSSVVYTSIAICNNLYQFQWQFKQRWLCLLRFIYFTASGKQSLNPHDNAATHKIFGNHARPLRWRHNDHDGVSYHQRFDCLLSRLFWPRSKKAWKLRVTGLCEENSPVNGEFPTQRPVTRKCFHLMTSSCCHAADKNGSETLFTLVAQD